MPEITSAFTLTKNGNNLILSVGGEITVWRPQNVLLTKNTNDTLTLTDTIVSFTMTYTDSLNPVSSSANDFLQKVSKLINDQPPQYSAFGEIMVASSETVIQLEFPYLVNPRLVNTTIANTGTVSVVNSMCTVSSGTTTASTASMESIKVVKYRPGHGVEIKFSGRFTNGGVVGTTQIIGVFNSVNGYGFGFNGISFGILHRIDSVDTWIPQTSWDIDMANDTGVLPTLIYTNLNVFKIAYQWLGAGAITFSIEDAITGYLEKVHIIRFSNTNSTPSLTNPSLPIAMYVDNGATTSDIIVQSASMQAAIQGNIPITGITNAFSNDLSGVNTTLDNVFSIRTVTTFGASPNRVEVILKRISVGTDGNGIVVVDVYRGATLTAPTWVAVDALSSIVETDIVGTAPTGGELLYSVVLGKTDSNTEDVTGLNILLAPGDQVTFGARTQSSTNTVSIAINWIEDF